MPFYSNHTLLDVLMTVINDVSCKQVIENVFIG